MRHAAYGDERWPLVTKLDHATRKQIFVTNYALFPIQTPILAFLGNDEIPGRWLTAEALTSEGECTLLGQGR